MRRWRLSNGELILFAGFCGCAAAPTAPSAVDVAPLHDVAAEHFPGAAGILAAFDARPDDERAGVDAALFAVAVHRDGEVDRRLLWLEASPAGATGGDVGGSGKRSPARRTARVTTTPTGGVPETHVYSVAERPVTLRHCLRDGELVRESSILLYDEPMRAGLWGYVYPGATREQRDLCTLYTMTLQALADEDESLRELLFLVVEKPSVLSVVANLGVRVYLRWIASEEGPLTWPAPLRPEEGWGRELRALQMQIDVNGAPALRGDLVVCEARGPLAIGGGVCGAVFRHPSDATRWAVVRLLAVRAGAAQAERNESGGAP